MKADKGDTVVIMDMCDYIEYGLNHLNNPDTNAWLDLDPTWKVVSNF